MRSDTSFTTISRFATVAIQAEARLCNGPEDDRKMGAALNVYRRAMLSLAATPAVTLADLQQKGLALETAKTGSRSGMPVFEGDFGLTGSMLRDLKRMTGSVV